jgi:hypothetical protein
MYLIFTQKNVYDKGYLNPTHQPFITIFTYQNWHAPKFLVRPKMGLSYSNNEIVKNLGHALNSQH